MRTFVAFLLLYLLFLIQASVNPWWPDLILLGLIAVSLHETRLTSAVAGAFAGLCLDMTNPAFAGTSLFALAVTGYGVAALRTLFYRARWATLLFVLMALTLKWTALALFGPGLPGLAPLLVSSVLTMTLAPLVELGLARFLYPGWQPA
jgi:rod shape-determining protein MreD